MSDDSAERPTVSGMSRRSVLLGVPSTVALAAAGSAAAHAMDGIRLGGYELRITTLEVVPPAALASEARIAAGLDAPQFRGDRDPALRPGENPGQPIFVDTALNRRVLIDPARPAEPRLLPDWIPVPSDQEWDLAVRVVRTRYPEVSADDLRRPMPPFVVRRGADGRDRRLICVAVREPSGDSLYRTHLVDLLTSTVLLPAEGEAVVPSHDSCGIPDQEGCRKVLPEFDAWAFEVRRDGNLIWRFDVLRARAGSGLNRSGVEVRRVEYRGAPVLSRGHVPILNVEYEPNDRGCGPSYRDWFGDEACFRATGVDFVGGLRLCEQPPVTIVDVHSPDADLGDFRGLAVHATSDEIVFTSETKAAWYRYVSQWRFSDGGAIRPRIAFGATDNPCTCLAHTHHAYWRFDFSWPGASIRAVEENALGRRRRPLLRESRLGPRGDGYEVRLSGVGDGWWRLRAGPDDGTASDYARADGWILRSDPAEIDDLRGFSADPDLTAADLDRFVTGQRVRNEPTTLWYSAHHGHACGCSSTGEFLGPDLLPDLTG
ncbi:hypothetical protein [Micromonospora sp. NPDC048843]|uniref:hypothetical protein n=1 Tax=Micromonospora sp. NPDC048843 TaxID=3155389 RepID=UPI003404890E